MNSVIWVGPKMNGIPRCFSLPWFLANWHESETVGMQRRKLKTNGFVSSLSQAYLMWKDIKFLGTLKFGDPIELSPWYLKSAEKQ